MTIGRVTVITILAGAVVMAAAGRHTGVAALALLLLVWHFLVEEKKLRAAAERHLQRDERRATGELENRIGFLQVLLETIPSPVFYKDAAGAYLGCNRAFERYIGISCDALIGRTVHDIAPPELAERYAEMDDSLFREPGIQVYESTAMYADGSRHEVIFNKATFSATDGTLGGLVGVILDVTDLKRAERLLAGEKQVLEMIAGETELPKVLELLCTTVEEFSPGSFCSVLLVDEDGSTLRHAAAPSLPEAYCRAIDGTRIGAGIGSCGTASFTRMDVVVGDIATDPNWARYRDLPLRFGLRSCWSRPILAADGTVLGTFAVYYSVPRLPSDDEHLLMERATDLAKIVIERKRSQESLRELQVKQQAILNNIPDLVWMKDTESRYLIVNRAFGETCGLPADEVVGKTDYELWPHDAATVYRKGDIEVMMCGQQTAAEEMIVGRWMEVHKRPIRNDRGDIVGTTGIARDIHQRKLAEEALRESEDRFHQIFVQNEDAIVLLQTDTFAVIDANPAALELYGFARDEFAAFASYPFIDSGDFERFLQALPLDDVARGFHLDKAHGRKRTGEDLILAVRGKIIRLRNEFALYCSIRDMTQQIRLEEEMNMTQGKLIFTNKMTSLGILASSIAHEINNPNNYISVNANLLTDAWHDATPILRGYQEEHGDFPLGGLPFSEMADLAPRLLKAITAGSQRINAIISNMKDFVRNDQAPYGTIDINRTVQDAATILWNHIQRFTDCFRLDLGPALPAARGNRQQLEQVVINLIMNALEALPDRGREVVVTTMVDEAAGMILLTVKDQGKGMDEEVLARVAEPFFSTRMDKGGTGLGLYISASIIKEHRGELTFVSSPGHGTTATISLPLVSVPQEPAHAGKKVAGHLP